MIIKITLLFTSNCLVLLNLLLNIYLHTVTFTINWWVKVVSNDYYYYCYKVKIVHPKTKITHHHMISNLYVAAEKEIAAYNFGMMWWVIHEIILICIPFKGIVHPKMKILSSLMSFQTCMGFYFTLNIEYILGNAGNQTVDGSYWLPQHVFSNYVNGDQQLFGSFEGV